jgi:hypothetical protein
MGQKWGQGNENGDERREPSTPSHLYAILFFKPIKDISIFWYQNLAIFSKTLAKVLNFRLEKKIFPNFLVKKWQTLLEKKVHWLQVSAPWPHTSLKFGLHMDIL